MGKSLHISTGLQEHPTLPETPLSRKTLPNQEEQRYSPTSDHFDSACWEKAEVTVDYTHGGPVRLGANRKKVALFFELGGLKPEA